MESRQPRPFARLALGLLAASGLLAAMPPSRDVRGPANPSDGAGRVTPPAPQGGAGPAGPSASGRTAAATPRPIGPRGVGIVRPMPREVRRPNGSAVPVAYFPGTRTVLPPYLPLCTTLPTAGYWRERDLMAEIQWLARTGFIPVSPIGDGVGELSDYAQFPAGWRAYGVAVPAGGTVQVEVAHDKLGWFRLMLVDKWGKPGPGMLQAAVAHQPVLVTYKNPGAEATAVYVIVDDPGRWSDAKAPYTLHVRRDWSPGTADLASVKMVSGLWGASPSVSAEYRYASLTGPAVFPR